MPNKTQILGDSGDNTRVSGAGRARLQPSRLLWKRLGRSLALPSLVKDCFSAFFQIWPTKSGSAPKRNGAPHSKTLRMEGRLPNIRQVLERVRASTAFSSWMTPGSLQAPRQGEAPAEPSVWPCAKTDLRWFIRATSLARPGLSARMVRGENLIFHLAKPARARMGLAQKGARRQASARKEAPKP